MSIDYILSVFLPVPGFPGSFSPSSSPLTLGFFSPRYPPSQILSLLPDSPFSLLPFSLYISFSLSFHLFVRPDGAPDLSQLTRNSRTPSTRFCTDFQPPLHQAPQKLLFFSTGFDPNAINVPVSIIFPYYSSPKNLFTFPIIYLIFSPIPLRLNFT